MTDEMIIAKLAGMTGEELIDELTDMIKIIDAAEIFSEKWRKWNHIYSLIKAEMLKRMA